MIEESEVVQKEIQQQSVLRNSSQNDPPVNYLRSGPP